MLTFIIHLCQITFVIDDFATVGEDRLICYVIIVNITLNIVPLGFVILNYYGLFTHYRKILLFYIIHERLSSYAIQDNCGKDGLHG
jgi:hypothetical protein